MLPCEPAGRLKARRAGGYRRYEYRLKGKANLSTRDMNSSRGLWDGTGLLLSVVTAAGDSSRTLRSSAISFSTLARTSVVGSTQSIGMELHFSVGQPSRSGPLP